MNEICEIVPSQKENPKINVHGYLMVYEKSYKNNDYWCCDKRKLENCKGQATTTFLNSSHYLKSFIEYTHSSQASDTKVAKTIVKIK